MITFDYLTLKAFYEENKSFFEGARLQKIQQATRRDFILTIRGGETRKLYINIDPQVYHLCFLSEESYSKRNIIIPQKPPMFCMLLRKYLEGFRITNISVPPYERILEIYFESYNELNEKIKLCLAIELMGKYSNVILYNCDTNTIIGCAHNVGSEKSRDRELAGTLPYIYPQKQIKADFLRYNGNFYYKELNKNFLGISKSFQDLLEKNKVPTEKIKDYIELASPITPSIEKDEYCIYSELFTNPVRFNSVNEMIDTYFSCHQEKILKRALRLKLKNTVYPLFKKQSLLVDKLTHQLEKKDNASKYKRYADLIMANLYNNRDFQKEIIVTDWETNQELKIPLDKNLTLKENAQKYYRLFSKSKNSIETLTNLKKNAISQNKYFEDILYSINSAQELTDLLEIESECEDIGIIKSKTPKKQAKLNIKEAEINGYKVYIGRNNKQNDYIISKLATPDDIWFHTQNTPGSHILLKITDNKTPDETTIYECCKLAKKYSSASDNTKAGIIYTRRKYLKKPPKTHLGYVTYKNEKEIIVKD